MSKFMIETIRNDNVSKYLANVFLLKVSGIPVSGNEWEFEKEEEAKKVAEWINSTFGGKRRVEFSEDAIDECVQVISVADGKESEEKSTIQTKKEISASDKRTGKNKKKEEDLVKEHEDGIKIGYEHYDRKIDDAIDWYSSLGDEPEHGKRIEREVRGDVKIGKNGKPLARSIYRQQVDSMENRNKKPIKRVK